MPTIDLDELVEEVFNSGKNPRVHPNGFIQLDLADVEDGWHASHKKGHSGASRRLHIWNPPGLELPHQGTVNEIHTHVFDMRSTVVRGELWQRLYEFDEQEFVDCTHELYEAVYAKNSDSRLKPTGRFGRLVPQEWFCVPLGNTYTQPAFTFHDTHVEDGVTTVTVMEKMEIHDGDAYVLCEIGNPPDNSFDRASAVSEHELWVAIRRSLVGV